MILVVVLTILYIEHNTGSGPHNIIHRAWYCFCSTQYYTSSMILVLVPTILYIEERVTWIHKILIFSQIWRRTKKVFKWIYVLHNDRKVSWAKITNVINVFTLNVVICLTNCGEQWTKTTYATNSSSINRSSVLSYGPISMYASFRKRHFFLN